MAPLSFCQRHAQLLGGPGTVDPERFAGATAFAADHFAGVGVCGQTSLIDPIAVVLGDQLARVAIELDQKIPRGIQSDETLREPLVQGAALLD